MDTLRVGPAGRDLWDCRGYRPEPTYRHRSGLAIGRVTVRDAPALTAAQTGVAMERAGSDLALQTDCGGRVDGADTYPACAMIRTPVR